VAILRAMWAWIGLTGVQVQVDGREVAGAEEVRPQVRVPLGHDLELIPFRRALAAVWVRH